MSEEQKPDFTSEAEKRKKAYALKIDNQYLECFSKQHQEIKDLTGKYQHFEELYLNTLSQLQKAYARNQQLEKENHFLKMENEASNKRLEELVKKNLEMVRKYESD